MRTIFMLLTVTFFFLPRLLEAEWVSTVNLQQAVQENAEISMPVSGQVVQGAVIVRGITNVEGFLSYDVDFAYSSDPTQTWFLVQESSLPIAGGVLAVWDTSIITDGDYNLRLVIHHSSGVQEIIEITGLQVRNYTPIETPPHTSAMQAITQVPDAPTVTATPRVSSTVIATTRPPTPAALPDNPAEITMTETWSTFGKGVIITLGIFSILGIYLGIRMYFNQHK